MSLNETSYAPLEGEMVLENRGDGQRKRFMLGETEVEEGDELEHFVVGKVWRRVNVTGLGAAGVVLSTKVTDYWATRLDRFRWPRKR